jgi:hypothetical protein
VSGTTGLGRGAADRDVTQPSDPLEEGSVVEALFLLSARPAKVRHLHVAEQRGGWESGQRADGADREAERTTGTAASGQRRPQPLPQEHGRFVFTTKFGPSVADWERELPGFAPGDAIVASARYSQVLYVEEYEPA